ncbi:SAGA complex subunit Sgf29 [Schizosaccharomyces japonicus yFS275]|uniref:SAGA complex subunit Sgf29 n=1 Tax=Schizosaccharomyces japonicus (strain yFS275 / FY16936) TaxID=402676 RepID=B6JXP3_SCHJY|nr:SAGA complex subunit Sgf29 [Schizosaccharomyces japonicus yFS275]EEB05187.1 SAGA complex subunit Sgf29 [Schizosaccharomyces japonicus yFS275]
MARQNVVEEEVESLWKKIHFGLRPLHNIFEEQSERAKRVNENVHNPEKRLKLCEEALKTYIQEEKLVKQVILSMERIVGLIEKAHDQTEYMNSSPLTRSRRNRSQSVSRSSPQPPVFSKGDVVAFRLPRSRNQDGGYWIQCIITKVIGEGSKQRFEVQDPEPDDDGNPGQVYRATASNLIYIPKDSAGLLELAPGTTVLARYPETTTFYKAEVIETLKNGSCKLHFEGEEEIGKETIVERRLILNCSK